jgi:tetratricopeptide (TPR) repeat protein
VTGELRRGLEFGERALELKREELRHTPARPELKLELVHAISVVASMLGALGDGKGATAILREGAERSDELLVRDPGNTHWIDAAANIRNQLGIQLENLGMLDEAAEVIEAQYAIQERGYALDPARTNLARGWSIVHLRKASLAMRRRTFEEALGWTERAVTIADANAARAPENLVLAQDAITARGWHAGMLGTLGRELEAIAIQAEIAGKADAIAEANPSLAVNWRGVHSAYLNLGDRQHSLGRVREAVASGRRAVDAMRRLLEIEPGNTQDQLGLARTLNRVAAPMIHAGDQSGAAELQAEALAIAEQLIADHPDSLDAFSVALPAINGLLINQIGRGDPALLEERLARTETLIDVAAAGFDQDAGTRDMMLGEALHLLGVAHQRLGDLDRAIGMFDRARATLPRNGNLAERLRLQFAVINHGQALGSAGRLTAAIDEGTSASASLHALVAEFPAMVVVRMEAASADLHLGHSLLAAGRADEAVDRVGQTLAGMAAASRGRAPNLRILRDTAQAVVTRSRALADLGRPLDALPVLEDAVTSLTAGLGAGLSGLGRDLAFLQIAAAEVLLEAGRVDDAAPRLDLATSLVGEGPGDRRLRLRLAMARARLHGARGEEADRRRVLESALAEADPAEPWRHTPESLVAKARLLNALGRVEEAAAIARALEGTEFTAADFAMERID